MLLSFSVRNHLSFRDEHTIFLNRENDTIDDSDSSTVAVYPVALVIGANSAGKSNLIIAMQDLKNLVSRKSDGDDKKIPEYNPFKLDSEIQTYPSSFQMEFFDINKKESYMYYIEFNKESIIKEQLWVNDNSVIDRNKRTIQLSDSVFNELTAFTNFYDTQSILGFFSSIPTSPEKVKFAYEFITKRFVCFNEKYKPDINSLTRSLETENSKKEKILSFLTHIGTGINEIGLYEQDDIRYFFSLLSDDDTDRIFFKRKDNLNNDKFFDWKQESTGTRFLLTYLPEILECFSGRRVLVIDEVDSSLHYEVVMLIIKLFNDKELNKYNSQLIISSHNLLLLEQDCFDKEQIFFVDKHDNRSQIYSLSEFNSDSHINSSNIIKWYLHGKFDALPPINYVDIVNTLREAD